MSRWVVLVDKKPVLDGDDYLGTLSAALEMGYQLKEMTITTAEVQKE